MSDWNIACAAMTLLFFLVIFLLLWLCKDQSKLEGKTENLREEVRLMRDECESLRIRLKTLEVERKQNITTTAEKCVGDNPRGLRDEDRN